MPELPITVARNAMATRFEIALFGGDPVDLRAAAEEALEEVQRVETMLSWRQPASPLARVNACAGQEPVRVNPELFALLRRCRELSELGNGAFDITVGPLMRAWGFHATDGQVADEAALAAAQQACGMRFVELDEAGLTVRFTRPGMRLDFGAIGKGYALDLAAEVLRDAGVTSALIHGGTSTVCAIGRPLGEAGWKIAVEYPPGASVGDPLPVLTVLSLCDTALSVSAVWGRVFRVGQDTFGHVIDPRLGRPANRALLSIFISPNATESDALSTALLVEGPPGVAELRERCPATRTLVLAPGATESSYEIAAHGIDWRPLPAANSPVAGPTDKS